MGKCSPQSETALLQNTLSEVNENNGLEVNREHQLLVYTADVNLLSENINIIKKNTEALSDASMEVGLEVNAEKTKYIFMSNHKTVGTIII
jgi:hypothetical protein